MCHSYLSDLRRVLAKGDTKTKARKQAHGIPQSPKKAGKKNTRNSEKRQKIKNQSNRAIPQGKLVAKSGVIMDVH